MLFKSIHRLGLSLVALGVTLSLGLSVGCTGSDATFPVFVYSDDGDLLAKPSGGGLVVDPDSPIPDVPKPIGFVPIVSKSSVKMENGNRYVTHLYQGRANPLDAAAFYRRNLDDYGWATAGLDQGDPRATVQSYTKGPENLRVNITRDRSVVSVHLVISPSSDPTPSAFSSGRVQPRTPPGSSPAPAPGSAPPSSDEAIPVGDEPMPEPYPSR